MHFRDEDNDDDENFIKDKYERMNTLFKCEKDLSVKSTEANDEIFKKLQ